jgi:hypothetical protein
MKPTNEQEHGPGASCPYLCVFVPLREPKRAMGMTVGRKAFVVPVVAGFACVAIRIPLFMGHEDHH